MATTAVTWGDLGRHLDAVPTHAVRVLAGTDLDGLAEGLSSCRRPKRPVVRLDASTYAHDTAQAVVRGALDDLGLMVSSRWPLLWGDDLTDVRDDALGRAHLPVRMAELAEVVPGLSPTWAVEAALRMSRGHGPAASPTTPALAWGQIVLALSPAGLTLAAPLPGTAPGAVLAALEWLAGNGEVAIVLLAPTLPRAGGPFDRVLFGARELADGGPGVEDRDGRAATVLADVEVDGRPHPGSVAERRLHDLIRADPELAPLFGFNRVVPEATRAQARVDILWSGGRVAVEVDGPEHRGAARYRADRHRDYELLRAGYRVLRLTNEEVAEDAGLALSKIRDVVRLSRDEGP